MDDAVLWRPAVTGVEVLHAYFRWHRYARHAHEAVAIALVDSGVATFDYRGERFVAPAGSVFLINSGAVHTGSSASPEGYRYRVLYVDPGLLASLVPPAGGRSATPTFRDTVVEDPAAAEALRRAHDAFAGPASRLEQEELLLHAGRLLLARYGEGGWKAERRQAGAGHRAVAVTCEYLQAHATSNVSLQELAAVASLSPYRLVRVFTAEVGMPPHAYQTQLRVWQARRLLAQGLPPARVATETGFYDQAHLTKVFKRYTGVTPARYARGVAG